jgi:DNA primase
MSVIDDVKSRLDILEVVSGYVPLHRSGRSYKANCPFHQEKTPSFYVFPDRQTWRCFGACATGGDVFSFVIKIENIEFGEALKRLAQQAGVALPNRERRSEQQIALQINEAAGRHFQQLLASAPGAGARAYLEGRGLTGQTIEKFGLGLSPRDGEPLKNYLVKQGFSLEQLALAGVVTSGDNGPRRDLFRNRLMIPIRNAQGDLAGFGGRALDDSTPKYLNSPHSPVFDKGRILYGLHFAREAVRQQGIVVVEGYMDAIMAHQHGFNNVVASMGTALTEHQVAEVRRLTSNITMALDADAAGQQATLRSLESSWQVFQTQIAGQVRGTTLFQRQEIPDLKVMVLPEGQDPDEVIRQSPEEWARLLESSRPLFEYLLPALAAQADISTPQGKAWVAQRLKGFIFAVPEPIQQDHYFQMLATYLKVSEGTLRASMGRSTNQAGPPRSSRNQRGQAVSADRQGVASQEPAATSSDFADHNPVEDYCLACILQHPEVPEAVTGLHPEYFKRLENREIFHRMTQFSPGTLDEPLLVWLRQNIDQELAGHLEALLNKRLPSLERQRWRNALQDAVRRLEERHLRELKIEEGMRFSEASPDHLLEEPYDQVLDLNQRIKENERTRNYLTRNASNR